MNAQNFVLQQYLDRIGFQGEARADLASITEMMRRQLYSVPFENLDVQAGKIVSLAPEDVVEKIVGRRRGGYCYEVNGIFAMALQALGVPYQFIAARPMTYPARRPRTHMAIVARLGGEDWLCDLGFGSHGIRAPFPMHRTDTPVRQDCDTYMLSRPSEREYLLQAFIDGEWANQYSFDMSFQEWIDFSPANYLNSTHPESIFVQKLLVTLQNENGRHILVGDTLKTVLDGRSESTAIAQEDIAATLREIFGLDPDKV